ncbi:uncharacterized protein comm3 [Calliphora vicina]|uniref:uncharacterized protein comm3 n=1 Tax=Calliphora vicina TaxID=7373 RepID=UPI00325BAACC
MSDLTILSNQSSTTDRFELQNFDLIQNYSVLINKLEQLALGVDATLDNIAVDHKAVELTLGNGDLLAGDPITASRAGPPHVTLAHGLEEVEYSRVVSDIWIGVILTLLIVSVIFFICACFLYHKFQQWKNSYRTNNNENIEICRNYPPNFEAESLPSYTIVSGLPTYDDAIEEFRKAGIILTPPMPVIKIFEAKETKDSSYNIDNINEADNISVASVNTCSCGGGNGGLSNNNSSSQQFLAGQQVTPSAINTQFIELSPEQLASLSQKRLSLQIAFPPAIRRNSRPRVDMRNNLLRSRAVGNTAGYEANFPQIHRSSSVFSLANERQNIQMMQHNMQHRGSLF